MFGVNWNGVSLMRSLAATDSPQETMLSDESGNWGCGATWNGKWFQLSWNEAKGATGWSIMPKELLPIVVAAVVWKEHWRCKVVKTRCDNMAVVATVKSGTCKEKTAMHLMRCLAFVEATVPMTIVTEHIRGVDNAVADALSRDRLDVARSIMQDPAGETEQIPVGLVELLTTDDHSWTGQEWRRLQHFCSTKV